MNESYIHYLIQPCKNRSVTFKNNGDGTVTINGKKLDTMSECENYLESIPRTDCGLKGPGK